MVSYPSCVMHPSWDDFGPSERRMNPLIHTLATTIAEERAMTADTANDRIEGYDDGASLKSQWGRSGAYEAANMDGMFDALAMLRRDKAKPPVATVSGWRWVINWLRARLS